MTDEMNEFIDLRCVTHGLPVTRVPLDVLHQPCTDPTWVYFQDSRIEQSLLKNFGTVYFYCVFIGLINIVVNIINLDE
jgi:hypothetical protein